ncbi:probable E3 ubiquitin-protein ligase RHC1A isoform X2 [Benincasa hispida]|uniref:probable E3 ubiquitin-protein ligase RHC1A isoform X2 n=1 Tax=Benincasa hispida TaxID=102211 RepID=UPI0019026320|nr:probable E3 ubiquitin-protein ligase RHC1A isoform X2 [Benincasa hispida]
MSMPQNPRSRIVINGGVPRTTTMHYYWCRICRRIIRISLGNPVENSITCPFCSRNLRHELDVARARNFPRLPSFATGNRTISPPIIPRFEETDESWITLRFSRPPANSGIEAIPRVKITGNHLEKDLNCAICKEEFEMGGEVRELPCKHFYHSDCVVPWLRIHNTCPVCRHTVENIAAGDDEGSGNGINGGRGEEIREEEEGGGEGRGNGWWDLVCCWWPFRFIGDWARRLRFADSGDSFFVVERSWMYSWLAN